MHLKVQRLPQLNPNTPLTLRQREVLQWVGDGKTMLDIATIMDLTPATVAKHLKMARDALNVETTAQAVLKLSMLISGSSMKNQIKLSKNISRMF